MDCRPSSDSSRVAVCWASLSSATWEVSSAFWALRSLKVSWEAVRFSMTLPRALKGDATTEPAMRSGLVTVVTPERTAWMGPASPSRM